MKIQTKALLAAAAFASMIPNAWAGPISAGVSSRTVTPLPEQTRRALVPAPATGPCRAELSMQRFEISRSADGTAYNVSITIANIGTEPATGAQTNAGGVLGISIEVISNTRSRSYFGQVADIDIIHPGTSRTFSGTFPARQVTSASRSITARIDRAPDGPRCAYDARVNNDGLGISAVTMRDWLAAGNRSYVRNATWDR